MAARKQVTAGILATFNLRDCEYIAPSSQFTEPSPPPTTTRRFGVESHFCNLSPAHDIQYMEKIKIRLVPVWCRCMTPTHPGLGPLSPKLNTWSSPNSALRIRTTPSPYVQQSQTTFASLVAHVGVRVPLTIFPPDLKLMNAISSFCVFCLVSAPAIMAVSPLNSEVLPDWDGRVSNV